MGRRWSPPGGLQSAAPPWWATACWTFARHLRYDLEILLRNSSAKIRTPLSFSLSPGPPGTANLAPKSVKVCFFRFLNRFFRASKRTSILTSKNHRKICEKHRFGGPKPFPTPSKIRRTCCQVPGRVRSTNTIPAVSTMLCKGGGPVT